MSRRYNFWLLKQLSTVDQSLKKSEFVGLIICESHGLWLHMFMMDFKRLMNAAGLSILFDVGVGEDNQACFGNVQNDQ